MTITLEIALRRGYRAAHEVELRVARSDDAGETRYVGTLAAGFDPAKLPPLGDGAAYGLAVGAALLADPRIGEGLDAATTASGADPLRVRLYVQPDAASLYGVAWETARDPRDGKDGALLFAGDRRVFSRFVSSGDIRPLYRRPGGSLRVLVAVASPRDVGDYAPGGRQLAPVEEELELERLEAALAGAAIIDVLRSSRAPVTLDALVEALGGDYDVLHLCCHGAINDAELPVLFLDGPDGATELVDGEAFVRRVSELRERPRLVVLASCQSASAAPGAANTYGAGGAFTPLGPRLAEAGVAAVVAMQGDVTIGAMNDFVPALFRQLVRHGTIDRAVSLARSEIAADHLEWWAPTLISRLRTGELFRRTAFLADPGDRFGEHWEGLLTAIVNGRCTPILGPALLERFVGTRAELAVRLARHFERPVPRGDPDLLALVTQQLALAKTPEVLRRRLLMLIAEMVAERFRGAAPPELLAALPTDVRPAALLARLRAILDFAVTREGPSEPHNLIARLELPIFVTTNPDDILGRAITRERPGVAPVTEIHRWREDHRRGEDPDAPPPIPSIWDTERDYRPSVERPLVFHFFGSAEYQSSLALTQDDYVDTLVAASASRADDATVHRSVRAALTSRTLLFLGFQLHDWSFRALFRFIMNQQGRELLRDRVHAAVQVDPEESGFDDPDTAAHYVKHYLSAALGAERVGIFWGTVGDFMAELYRQRGVPVGDESPTVTAERLVPTAAGGQS